MRRSRRKHDRETDRRLSEYALVYLVTKAGGWAGNLFVLSVEDAKTLCSDECSRGWGRGGPWHFQWTTIDHFAQMNDTYNGRRHRVPSHLPRVLGRLRRAGTGVVVEGAHRSTGAEAP